MLRVSVVVVEFKGVRTVLSSVVVVVEILGVLQPDDTNNRTTPKQDRIVVFICFGGWGLIFR